MEFELTNYLYIQIASFIVLLSETELHIWTPPGEVRRSDGRGWRHRVLAAGGEAWDPAARARELLVAAPDDGRGP